MDVFITIFSAIMAFAIIINGFVISLYIYRRQLLRNYSNRLLVSLSCCDFLSGVGILSRILIQALPVFKQRDCITCLKIRICIEILTTFLVECIVLHLCAITVDRFLSIFYSLRYKAIVTSKKLKFCIVFCWVFSFIASSVQIFWLYPFFENELPSVVKEREIFQIEVWFSISSLVLFHFLPLLLLGIAFLAMFIEIRKLILKVPTINQKKKKSKEQKQRRILYTFGTMYLFFCFLTFPFFTVRLIHDLNSFLAKPIMVDPFIYKFVYTMKIIPSCINPIIYITFNQDFRSAIQKIYYQKAVRNQLNPSQSYFSTGLRRLSTAFSISIKDKAKTEKTLKR